MATEIHHVPRRAHQGWRLADEEQPSPSKFTLISAHTPHLFSLDVLILICLKAQGWCAAGYGEQKDGVFCEMYIKKGSLYFSFKTVFVEEPNFKTKNEQEPQTHISRKES